MCDKQKKTNAVMEVLDQAGTVKQIKALRLKWLGHIMTPTETI